MKGSATGDGEGDATGEGSGAGADAGAKKRNGKSKIYSGNKNLKRPQGKEMKNMRRRSKKTKRNMKVYAKLSRIFLAIKLKKLLLDNVL